MKPHHLLIVAAACAALTGAAQAISVFGLGVDNQLYRFDTANPAGAVVVGGGLGGIVDIDFRGSNGQLYGIAANGNSFSVNTSSATLTSLFSPNPSFSGSVTSLDFNPAVDRMRILVGGNTNFRMVPDGITGTAAGTVVNGATGDGSFATPAGVSILGLGYTNPTGGATTDLYSIGSNGFLYIHSVGPQFNTMTALGTGLGFTIDSPIGFDIASNGLGYLSHGDDFYSVNLASGSATFVGSFGVAMRGVAVVPEPTSLTLAAVAGLGLLRRRR